MAVATLVVPISGHLTDIRVTGAYGRYVAGILNFCRPACAALLSVIASVLSFRLVASAAKFSVRPCPQKTQSPRDFAGSPIASPKSCVYSSVPMDGSALSA